MAYPEVSPRLDLTVVDTHNPLTIGIADISFYPTSFQILNPTYEITPPSFAKATVTFTPGALTVFNSNTLNITCVDSADQLTDLPDGIWSVRMSIAPPIKFNIYRTFIRTTLIQRKFGNAFLKTDLNRCNTDMRIENMKILDEVFFFIQAAVSAANQCNNLLAMDLYRTADTMLDNFLHDRCRGVQQTLWC